MSVDQSMPLDGLIVFVMIVHRSGLIHIPPSRFITDTHAYYLWCYYLTLQPLSMEPIELLHLAV
jgi:hypothetical protein